MPTLFTNPDHRRAAQAVVACVTAAEDGTDPEGLADLAVDLLDGLTEFDVLAAATVLLDRIVHDASALLRLDYDETLARLGTWVAADEFTS